MQESSSVVGARKYFTAKISRSIYGIEMSISSNTYIQRLTFWLQVYQKYSSTSLIVKVQVGKNSASNLSPVLLLSKSMLQNLIDGSLHCVITVKIFVPTCLLPGTHVYIPIVDHVQPTKMHVANYFLHTSIQYRVYSPDQYPLLNSIFMYSWFC